VDRGHDTGEVGLVGRGLCVQPRAGVAHASNGRRSALVTGSLSDTKPNSGTVTWQVLDRDRELLSKTHKPARPVAGAAGAARETD